MKASSFRISISYTFQKNASKVKKHGTNVSACFLVSGVAGTTLDCNFEALSMHYSTQTSFVMRPMNRSRKVIDY